MLTWLRNILLIALLAMIAAPWWVVVKEASSAAPFRDYLATNAHVIDLDNPDGSFALPEDFYDNRLFLMGEIHGMQTAQAVDMAMMRHLHERIGLRHVLAEMDATQADRVNAYLASGDESVIRPIFETWLARDAQWGNQQHFDKLRDLRAWMANLPPEDRLIYFGLDRIQDMDNALDWFAYRLEQSGVSANEALSAALAADRSDTQSLRLAFTNALPALDAELAYMAQNILAGFEEAGRYESVFANLEILVHERRIGDDEPLYGFWGLFHSLSVTVNNGARPLALRLRESDLPFADEIVTLSMFYAASEQNLPSRMLPEFARPDAPFFNAPSGQDNPYLMYLQGIGDLKAAAGNADATAFRINQPGSPYADGARLIEQSGLMSLIFRFQIDPFEGYATDYAILIQNSPALTAFNAGE